MKVNSAPVGASACAIIADSRVLNAEPDAGPERHHDVDEHRHPGRRHVDEDDPVGLALLRVGGRDEEADVQARRRASTAAAPTNQRRDACRRADRRSAARRTGTSVDVESSCGVIPIAMRKRRRGRPAARRRSGDEQQRAEQRQMRRGADSPRGARLDRAGAEDQHRHVQRQHQQRQQHAAAAQRRASARRRCAPIRRQHRRAEQQRQRQHAERAGVEVELQRRAAARAAPAAGPTPASAPAILPATTSAERARRRAASARACRRRGRRRTGAAATSIDASSAATQSTPGAIARSSVRLGADAEREQARHDDEEEQRRADVAAPAQREQQVAADDAFSATASIAGAGAQVDHAACCAHAGFLVRGVDHRAAARRRARRCRPSHERAAVGVERGERLVEQPQRRRPLTRRRASAARRRWPCESWRTGSRRPARRSRASAARDRARADGAAGERDRRSRRFSRAR